MASNKALAEAVLLGPGSRCGVRVQPLAQIGIQQLGFQATVQEQPIDVEQLVAELTVIDIALDGGQDWGQGQLKGDKISDHHEDRL